MNTSIRLLTPPDADAYVALRSAMLLDTPFAFTASPETDRGSDVARVAESLARPGFAIAGAFDRDKLVSTAVLMREDTPKRAHLAWLVSVYTAPAARRRGLARRIISHLLDHARTWTGLAAVLLSVNERTPGAQALYEALGFVAWGTEPDAVRVDGASSAEIHMRLAL